MFLSFGGRSMKRAMASRAAFNAIRSLKQRLYSTQTAFKETARPLSTDVQVSKLEDNGITVATIDCQLPVAWLSIAVTAGSRFESFENLGINHFLRRGIELGNEFSASFGVVNTIFDSGANFSCVTNREQVIYSIECLQQEVEPCLGIMLSSFLSNKFRNYEVADLDQPMKDDLALLHSQPDLALYEMLHSASYAGGLGRSLYAPDQMIGKFSVTQLQNFKEEFYTPDRMVLVGIGVDHEYLTDLCGSIERPTKSNPVTSPPSHFKGGEERNHLPNFGKTFAAVAVEGPSLKSKENLAARVLQYVMGAGPRNKYSSDGSSSLLGKSVLNVTEAPCTISCFNMAYSDSGLFGFSASGDPSEMDKILKAAFMKFGSVTKDGTITDADIKRAKNQLKADIAMSLESSSNVIAQISEQIMNLGKVIKLDDLFEMIDSISKQDVVNVAKKVVNGKQSMAVTGDLSNTPYLYELNK